MKLIASAALALVFSAGISAATPLALTFDIGANDPNVSGGPHGPYDWIESGARIAANAADFSNLVYSSMEVGVANPHAGGRSPGSAAIADELRPARAPAGIADIESRRLRAPREVASSRVWEA
jgi:hypothetical protein